MQFRVSIAVVILFVCQNLLAQSPITILEENPSSITVEVRCGAVETFDEVLKGETYQHLKVLGFHLTEDEGQPQLPYVSLKLATQSRESLSWTILEEEVETLQGIQVIPSKMPPFAAEHTKQRDRYRKNLTTYSADVLYPSSTVQVLEQQTYHGVSIATIGFMPVRCNPRTMEVQVSKRLVVKVDFAAPYLKTPLRTEVIDQLKNSVVNPEALIQPRNRALADDEDDILIITTAEYMPAVDKLALWQRKKGFGVKILTNNNWTTSSVDQAVKSFYNNATVKPGYLLIVGSYEDVPAELTASLFIGYGDDDHVTDHYYTCMDGVGDYAPEMARGRISVATLAEANTIVEKTIRYESLPPMKSSFYSNALACGFFQSYNNSNDENNDPNTADRRFAQTAEEILNYLETGYAINSERIYCAEPDVTPLYWNDGSYSWGEPVPTHLRRPAFAWDGDRNDIAAGINAGSFLVYHYDHGYESGWGDPAFSSNNVRTLLSNGELLPLIYSIDCLVGKFNYRNYSNVRTDCFAEVVTKKADGGAIAIVAATTLSSSGNNEALLDGMIDAVWPGLVLKTPRKPNPTVLPHEPMYRMGDIMNQGFLRMSETWSTNNSKYHNSMYHLFGDPTTPLWTSTPQDVVVTYAPLLNVVATTFSLEGLNVEKGVATLYNPRTDLIVGKEEVVSGDNTITISAPGVAAPIAVGDTLELTIVGQNYRPLMQEVVVNQVTPLSKVSPKLASQLIRVSPEKILFAVPAHSSLKAGIYTLQGRLVRQISLENTQAAAQNMAINISSNNFAQGLYVIQGNVGEKQFSQQVILKH